MPIACKSIKTKIYRSKIVLIGWDNILETIMLQITSYVWDVISSRVNYVSLIRSYLEHYSFQNITPAN